MATNQGLGVRIAAGARHGCEAWSRTVLIGPIETVRFRPQLQRANRGWCPVLLRIQGDLRVRSSILPLSSVCLRRQTKNYRPVGEKPTPGEDANVGFSRSFAKQVNYGSAGSIPALSSVTS
jgi:hypothetical protein